MTMIEKKTTNCRHGLTSYCPQISHPAMQGLQTEKLVGGRVKVMSDPDEADKLCRSCDKYEAFE